MSLAVPPHENDPASTSKSQIESKFSKVWKKEPEERRRAERVPLFWKNAVTVVLFHFPQSQCDPFRVQSKTAEEQFDFYFPAAFERLRPPERTELTCVCGAEASRALNADKS